MDGKHPKRRKDKYTPYTLNVADGKFYLSFRDGTGALHEMEIDSALYETLNAFELDDLSYLNEWDRHIEHSELSEETLEQRMWRAPLSVEEAVYRRMQYERLYQAIDRLPKAQRRRLILYYFYDFTYEKIAEIEGCSIMPVKRSIDRALEKIKKFFENRG